jgi:pSer/pThr/pTyr-binding forkhead associated (FHA) protein
VCRQSVTDREPVEVNRPRLGVLRLSTDPEPVALERGVVLGREPTAQADVDRIALRQPDISANHVEVRLEGWRVLLVDLGSTNGTVVTGPDGGSTELTPHVPVELHHGTEVALSDEISFRFEVTS